MTRKPELIVITGPTAVGKTDLCVDLAKTLETVIVNADSRQFFREMSIGTAKPTAEEMKGVKHYFIDSHSVTEEFSAGHYERAALELLDALFKTYHFVILTGGSGLYIKALLEGFDDFPEIDPNIRERLNARFKKEGLIPLQEELKEKDPDYYGRMDIQNWQRVIRALEVIEGTGQAFSSFQRPEKKKERPFNIHKYCLDRPREELYARINQRVDLMMAQGLLEEVKSLKPYWNTPALRTVGYQEFFAVINDEMSLEKAVEHVKQNTRRFAKRQWTWIKKDPEYIWIHPNQAQEFILEDIRPGS